MNITYRIIVGVDGSEGGARALRWAAREAESRGGTIQAVMAWEWDGPAMAAPMATHPAEVRQYTEDVLNDAVRSIRTDFPTVTVATEAVEGKAGPAVARAAAGADLLVLGSHGHGRLRHAVLGSVAEACIRTATTPVVVVPVGLGTGAAPAEEVLAVS